MDPLVPVQNIQDADNEAGENQVAGPSRPNVIRLDEARSACLKNHLILGRIFSYFDMPELIQLSVVNRLWMVKALNTIRNRGHMESAKWRVFRKSNTLAPELWNDSTESLFSVCMILFELERQGVVIDREYLTANMTDPKNLREIQGFVYDLVEMSSTPRLFQLGGICVKLPLCGIYVKLPCVHDDSCPPVSELNKLRSQYHNFAQPTFLEVHFGQDSYQHQGCPGFMLLTQLFRSDEWYIKQLSLLVTSEWKQFRRDVLQKCTFKHLGSLIFRDEDSYTTSAPYASFIKRIVRRAPNLRVLNTTGRVDLRVNLLEGSQASHLTFYPYSPSLDEIPENAIDSLRMNQMELLGVAEDFSLEKFDRITRKVLQGSRSTLYSMTIDFPFLLPLMAYGISLERVTMGLNIVWDTNCFHEYENQGAWNLIKSIDFNRVFPNLKFVVIKADWESHLRQKQVLNAFNSVLGQIQENVAPDRAVNIKGLNLELGLGAELTEGSIEYLGQMFPNVRALWMRAKHMMYFGGIWRSWLNLKNLYITLIGAENDPSLNLDSLFCGIFPEEVAELREKDDEYLKAVNIVPVMPSIASLKSLKVFELHLEGNCDRVRFDADNPRFLFSKVTPLIPFRNIHRVSISTRDGEIPEALSHLLPYISCFDPSP